MQQLADEAGCSKSQINSVEGRARNIGFIMGCRIAKALGVKNPFRLLDPEK
jgi:transcriptional regulator with XRE-family HTH domain